VIKGLDVVRKIGTVKTGAMDKPVEPLIINKMTIRR